MIQAFIDESGTKGTHPVFVLAGFIAPAEEWAKFATEWEQHRQAKPAIAYLKMAEAAKGGGQFDGWSEAAIDAKLRGFVEIIRQHAHRAIYVAIDLAAHEELHPEGATHDAYFLGFYSILSGVCWDVLDVSGPEQIEVIFDEHFIFQNRVALWYPAIKDAMRTLGNEDQIELEKVLPPFPSFRNDTDFVPLQAADVLAWLFRTALSGDRTEFEWIATELMPSIPMSSYASIFTRQRMQDQVEMSKSIVFPEEHLAKWRDVLGVERKKVKSRSKSMKVEHQLWMPTIPGGIDGQRIAIVGYSHHYSAGDGDHNGITQAVIQGVMDETEKHAFFTSIRDYFGWEDHKEFWSRVYFFNFLIESIGQSDDKYRTGSKAQREDGRQRFLRFIEDEKPDKVFIFTRKGWKSFPETTLEELSGRPCNRLMDDVEEPTWGTYMVGGHRVLACGFRHPQYAKGEDLKLQVQTFLHLHPKGEQP